jgi:hypothetical protein
VGLASTFVIPSPNTLDTAGERVGTLTHTAQPGSDGNGSRDRGRAKQGHRGRQGQQRHRRNDRRR